MTWSFFLFINDKNYNYSIIIIFCIKNNCIFAGKNKDVGLGDKRCKWVYLLKNMHKMTLEDEEKDPIFKKLYEVSRLSNLNEEVMREYKKSVLEYQDVRDSIKYVSRRYFEEGEKRGEKREKKKRSGSWSC